MPPPQAAFGLCERNHAFVFGCVALISRQFGDDRHVARTESAKCSAGRASRSMTRNPPRTGSMYRTPFTWSRLPWKWISSSPPGRPVEVWVAAGRRPRPANRRSRDRRAVSRLYSLCFAHPSSRDLLGAILEWQADTDNAGLLRLVFARSARFAICTS